MSSQEALRSLKIISNDRKIKIKKSNYVTNLKVVTIVDGISNLT